METPPVDRPNPETGTGTDPTRPRARRWLTERSREELTDELQQLAARLSAGTYELLVLAGEFDARGLYVLDGSLTAAAWLAEQCGIEPSTSRSQLRVARAMRAHPCLDAAMADGDISYTKARVLVPHLTDENAEILTGIALVTPTAALGAAIAAWAQRSEDPELIRNRQHDARSVCWRTEADGTVVITVRLTPETAAGVCAAIDAKVTRTTAPAGASLPQQRADALASLATEGGASITAEVVIHVDENGNRLPDGTPLSDRAVTELLPDAFISLLMHDSERYPIDASPRRRQPTRRQRRVLDRRQPRCNHPGCSASVFLQYDHIDPWAGGGPTTLENLQRLCGPHNRARASGLQAGGRM